MRFDALGCLAVVGSFAATGCSDAATVIYRSQGTTGELSVTLGASGQDVTAVRIDIVAATEACGATPIASQTVPIDTDATLAAGDVHASSEARFVSSAGEVRVCAAPLAGDAPSRSCSPTEALATVVAGETSEVSLVSQCAGREAGALHATVAFNAAPSIDALSIEPAEDITICESTLISVTASDPEGDVLGFSWSADGGRLRSDGASAIFSAATPLDYAVSVDVTDAHGGAATLEVPIQVTAAVCAAAPEVQSIFLSRCSPCHTVGASGGLKLDTAENAYLNLVGQPARGAACTARTRVIPGDAGASYLIAKLRGEAGICGVQMPRNLPPLPEAEIQTIASWINSLPH